VCLPGLTPIHRGIFEQQPTNEVGTGMGDGCGDDATERMAHQDDRLGLDALAEGDGVRDVVLQCVGARCVGGLPVASLVEGQRPPLVCQHRHDGVPRRPSATQPVEEHHRFTLSTAGIVVAKLDSIHRELHHRNPKLSGGCPQAAKDGLSGLRAAKSHHPGVTAPRPFPTPRTYAARL
jgi:hypothetical protein